MLTLPPSVRLWACTTPVDLRKSFDGLSGAVEVTMGQDAMSGQVFVFFNKRASQIRLLWWDRDGWMLVAKRLEAGRFQPPWLGRAVPGRVWEMEAADLSLVLAGVDIRGARRLPRWRPKPAEAEAQPAAGS